MNKDLLLTPEEIKDKLREMQKKYPSLSIDCSPDQITTHEFNYICQVQLDKVKSIVETQEQQRILEYLKSLLHINSHASLASTIDLIETTGWIKTIVSEKE